MNHRYMSASAATRLLPGVDALAAVALVLVSVVVVGIVDTASVRVR